MPSAAQLPASATDQADGHNNPTTSSPSPSSTHIIRSTLATAGEIITFSGAAIRSIPDLRKYSSEVLRQAGVLILSSALIIWVMEAVLGAECGLEGTYTLKTIGAPLYAGVFNAWCSLRICAPYMFGYMYAAKVGCGIVAELGSMRISDEIDAMEVMGIPSRTYLVSARILAAWISMPFIYVIGITFMFVGAFLMTVTDLGGVSTGGYTYVFWLYQNPYDFIGSLVKAMLVGTAITLVSCYYGFTARGGPVGVGRNVAKSMVVNLVLIHLIAMIVSETFWSLTPNAPIAN